MTRAPATVGKVPHAEALKVAEIRRDGSASVLRHRGTVLPSLSVDAAAYGSEFECVDRFGGAAVTERSIDVLVERVRDQ